MNLNLFLPVKFYLSPDKNLFRSIKNIFGFYPGNIFLYKLAFQHRSVATKLKGFKLSNERLEYLGDAVLSSIVADFLFKKFPYKDEGFLTEMRSKIVSRSQLNKLSYKLGIDKFIQSDKNGNNVYRSMNGDAFEAFIGALYLDKGYGFTKKIIINRIIKVHFNIEELENLDINFKSKLIEWAQKEKNSVEFKVIDEVGSGYKKQYIVEVLINNITFTNGRDFSIKGAEQNAAEKAINKIMSE
ncbi:MAG: ribonuclease III [Bacteroidales bacterium]|nr:ribonuclease III [Bacteroidales bacterium]